MSPENLAKITNPSNLPVIEENSLHRLVTTVKLYQEFESLGKEKFEEIYSNADPKSLEGVCYDRYYQNYSNHGDHRPFELLKNPQLQKSINIATVENSPLESQVQLGLAPSDLWGTKGWQLQVDGVDFLKLGDYLKVTLGEYK